MKPGRGTQLVQLRVEYRRREGRKIWHRCINCSHWPLSCHVASSSKPTTGKLCRVCTAKHEANECIKHLVR